MNETVKGIKYDADNGILFMAVEVRTNIYLNSPGATYETWVDSNGTNQTNIALIAYDKDCKIRNLITL